MAIQVWVDPLTFVKGCLFFLAIIDQLTFSFVVSGFPSKPQIILWKNLAYMGDRLLLY